MKFVKSIFLTVLFILSMVLSAINFIACEKNEGELCDKCDSNFDCKDGLRCLRFTGSNGRTWDACGESSGVNVCPE